MSRTNRPPISLSRLLRYYDESKRNAGRVAVVIGKVLDDERKLRLPSNIRLCALQISETARARIEAAGGQVMTLDQLALMAPRGENTILIRGRLHQRRCYKHFVGVMGREHVRPYTRSKGRKFERARGRRKSRGFKV
jgi:large subunit ribosomal protein L18e